MKKVILGLTLFVAVSITVGVNMLNNEEVEYSDLLLANVEALAYTEDNNNVVEDYYNKTDKFTTQEFKTDISENGIKIEYKRSCRVWHTYCDYSKGRKCYKDLNKTTSSCDSWEKK